MDLDKIPYEKKIPLIKLIDAVMEQWDIHVWDLDHYYEHECERCDH